jgi:hypothetical protein
LFSEESKASKQTLEEVIPVFIQMHAKPRNRGWRAAERVLSKFGPLNHRPLDEIKRSEVVQVLDTLIASGMTAGTNRALSAIKTLMSWALNRGMIVTSPH